MPFELKTVLVFLVALLSAVFILPKLSAIALRIGLVDYPTTRKDHGEPRSLVGGIGLVIAATFSSLCFISDPRRTSISITLPNCLWFAASAMR